MRYTLLIEDYDDPIDFRTVSELIQWLDEHGEELQFNEMEEEEL